MRRDIKRFELKEWKRGHGEGERERETVWISRTGDIKNNTAAEKQRHRESEIRKSQERKRERERDLNARET